MIRIGVGSKYPIFIKLIQFDHSLNSYLHSICYFIILMHFVLFFWSCSVNPVLSDLISVALLLSLWLRYFSFSLSSQISLFFLAFARKILFYLLTLPCQVFWNFQIAFSIFPGQSCCDTRVMTIYLFLLLLIPI